MAVSGLPVQPSCLCNNCDNYCSLVLLSHLCCIPLSSFAGQQMNTTYFGGKSGSGTYQTIINQIPPHRVYIELFGGMAGIFRHKREAQYSLILEKDRAPFDWYSGGFFNLEEMVDVKEVFRAMEFKSRSGKHSY